MLEHRGREQNSLPARVKSVPNKQIIPPPGRLCKSYLGGAFYGKSEETPFGELAGLLAPYPQFLPCYKGCIVNAERVERIDALVFRMDNGAGVPFAQREKKKLEGLYSSYLFQREREDALL